MIRKPGYEKCAHLYDLFDTKNNIDFFLRYGQEVGEILDIGAGTGRIAIPLAEHGITVTCIEPSPAMRAVFRGKLKDQHLRAKIRLLEGDARTFRLNKQFPAAFLSGTFDHFLDDDERIASLQNIHNHLQIEGILVFDVFLGLMKGSELKPAGTVREGKREYRRSVGSTVLEQGIINTLLRFEVYESGILIDTIEEHSRVGIVNRKRIHKLLQQTGFSIWNEYGGYDSTPYRENSELLIIEVLRHC